MNKPASVCTLVRRALKLQGRTVHSGRGFFHMDHDVNATELERRMRAAIVEWKTKGLVESVTVHAGRTEQVRFVENMTQDGYYRTVVWTAHGELWVTM